MPHREAFAEILGKIPGNLRNGQSIALGFNSYWLERDFLHLKNIFSNIDLQDPMTELGNIAVSLDLEPENRQLGKAVERIKTHLFQHASPGVAEPWLEAVRRRQLRMDIDAVRIQFSPWDSGKPLLYLDKGNWFKADGTTVYHEEAAKILQEEFERQGMLEPLCLPNATEELHPIHKCL